METSKEEQELWIRLRDHQAELAEHRTQITILSQVVDQLLELVKKKERATFDRLLDAWEIKKASPQYWREEFSRQQIPAPLKAMLAGKPYDYQVDRDFPSDNMS